MTEHIKSIDYTNFTPKAKNIAENCDTDGVKGLQQKEIIDFTSQAIKAGIEKSEIYELMGVSVTRAAKAPLRAAGRTYSEEFNKAVNKYNNEFDYTQRQEVTAKTYNIGYEKLYNMEKAIDKAYEDCQVYQDINIATRPIRPYYRYYPTYNDLVNFDLEKIRTMTTEDMESLNVLRQSVQNAIDDAAGREITDIVPVKYDVNEIAKKFLPDKYKSYEEFANANSELLEKFQKAVPDTLTKEEYEIYTIAKNYAKEMLKVTIEEARTARWDTGEQMQNETSKFLDDMWEISNFEYEGITDEGLAKIKSGVMFKSFEEALVQEAGTGVETIKADQKTPKKIFVNGHYEIHHPDGSVYDIEGRKLK